MSSTGIIYRLTAHDNASRTFNNVGRAAGHTDSALAKLGRTAMKAGAAVAGGLAVGLAKGAKDAARFQAEMTRISTQAGGTAKDVKVLSDQVLKLGTSTQQGPQHLAESLYHLKSVGMDNVQAMKALRESSDLAAVGHANLEETTNALAGAWRTGIKGATSFHQAVSTVNAIIGAGNMSMDQFNAAIGTGILPSAKTFGLSMKQVGAALALMTDEGIDSASAATRLRMSFSLLGAPSGAAEKQLKRIGLTGLNLADAMRGPKGLIGAISLLKEHLDKSGMSASKQSQLLSRAFGGGRSSSGILLMLNNLDVLEKKQEQINRSTGKFDDAVKMQRKTAEAQWHLLTSNLEVMGIRVGTKVLPPVTGFIHFLATDAMPAAAAFGTAMGKLIPVSKIKQGVSDAKSMVNDFFSGLTPGKSVSSMFGDFMDGLTGKKAAPTGGFKLPKAAPPKNLPPSVVNYGMSPAHPTGAPAATGLPPSARAYGINRTPNIGARNPLPPAAVAYGQNINRHLPKPQKLSAAQQLGKTIRDSISGGIDNIDWGKLGANLGKGLGSAIGWVGKHTAEFTKQIGAVLGKIDFVEIGKSFGGAAIPLAIGFIENLFAPLFSLSFWKAHWLDTIIAVLSVIPIGRIAGALGKVFEHIPILKVFEPLLRGIGKLGGWVEKAVGKSVIKPLGRLGKAIWDGIVSGFTKVLPGAAGKASEFIGKIAVGIVAYTGRFIGAGERLIGGLGRGILSLGRSAGEWIGKIVGWIVKPFARAGSWLVGKGTAVVTGLRDGITTGAKAIGSWAWRVMGRPVVDAFKGAGSWLVGKGRSLVSGLKSGTTSAAKGIAGWSKAHVIDPVTGAFKSSGSWLYTRGRSLVSGLKSGTTAGAVRIAGWMNRTVISPITSAFKGAGSWLLSRGKSLLSGLKSGVSSAAVGVAGWMGRTVIKPLTGAFKSAGSWLKSAGGHLLSGLKSGIWGAIKGIGSWIKKNMIDPIVNAVKGWFGIKSPSRVFMSIGGHLVGGLVKGMATTSGTAIAKKVFGDLPHALSRIVHKGLVSVSKLPKKALNALSSIGDSIGLGDNSTSGSAQEFAQAALKSYGWGPSQWPALKALWNGESGWNYRALNASSGAYGIPQALPASKMASAGSDWKTNAATQIKWGLSYIRERYGSPAHAWAEWQARSPHWYAKGTRGGAAKGLAWVGERGPELVNFHGGEDVLSNPDSMRFAKAHGIKLPGYASGTIQNAADRVRRDREKVEDAKDALSRAKRRHKGEAAAEKRLEAARKELKAAEIALSNAKRSAKNSISNSIKTGLEKTLATGTSSAIGSAIKSLATKLLNAGYDRTAKSVQKKGTKLQTLASKKADVHARIAEAKQYATDQAGNLKDFMSISGTSATNVGDLITQLGGKQKTASSFVKLTKSLKKRGASKELLAQLAEAGPGSQLATVLGAKGVRTQDIAKLNKLMKSGGKLATSFGRDMADMMYDSGKNAGKGFLSGLKSQEKALGKQMASVAKDLVKAIKKALKIKSPSVVFRDEIGKNVVLGMAHGIDRHGHLVGAATQRLADTATGITMRRRYVPTAATGNAGQDEVWERLAAAMEQQASQPQQLTGQLVLDSGELLGVIQGTVKPMIKQSENTQAFRARVGRR
ncbi:phage tail tape measure protein [Streptomyces sp. NPDC015684]|uniref:phage tail tape measure protein n=1 Tax=Streptomyces sp. NPDC015684 TaxID=3364963 RepID=UPI0036FE5EDD